MRSLAQGALVLVGAMLIAAAALHGLNILTEWLPWKNPDAARTRFVAELFAGLFLLSASRWLHWKGVALDALAQVSQLEEERVVLATEAH